ncbi:unnamed protein product [Boreogadus saida]
MLCVTIGNCREEMRKRNRRFILNTRNIPSRNQEQHSSISHSLHLHLTLTLSISLSLPPWLYPSISLTPSTSLSLPAISLTPSISHSIHLSLTPSISISLPPSLSLSLTPSLHLSLPPSTLSYTLHVSPSLLCRDCFAQVGCSASRHGCLFRFRFLGGNTDETLF